MSQTAEKPGFPIARRVVLSRDSSFDSWLRHGIKERRPRQRIGNVRGRHVAHSHGMEAEAAVRTEWAKLPKNRPGPSLSAIIEIAAKRHSIWPLASEFTQLAAKGEGKWPNERPHARPYEPPDKGEGRIHLYG